MTQEEMFGRAAWLGGGGTPAPCFRASFHAPSIRSASVTICGLGYFYLWINGQKVSEDLFVPVVSDYAPRPITVNGQPFDEEMRHRCYCLRYPIGALLHPGKNELAAALGPGFYGTETWSFDKNVSYGESRLCYLIQITDDEGITHEIPSDDSVRWAPGIVTQSDFYQGEKQVLSQMDEGWTTADYSAWQPVRILPPLDTDYQLQDCPADGIIRYLTPTLVQQFAASTVYDAGENISGWVILRDEGAPGDKLQLSFSEALSSVGALDEHYVHRQYFEVVSDGRGRIVHPLFTWHGFRYFSVKGKAKVLSVAVIHSRVDVSSSFSCSHPTLNWLYHAYLRTQLANLHGGIPSDCPHLERRGYTGDGQLTCETALLCLDYAQLLRKWMRDISDCQDIHSGHVQNTAPYTRCGGGPGGWGCAIITVPYQYYRHTGDSRPLRDMYPGMCHYIQYMLAHSEKNLVTSDRAGEWCLGDWCAPGGTHLPPPFVNTCLLVKSLQTLMKIEKILGLPAQAEWPAAIEKACAALTQTYLDPASGQFCGGMEGADAFALDIGLGDERTWAQLVARYAELGYYDTGIFGTEIVTRVLLEGGASALAYSLLTSEKPTSFHGWRKAGATTLWEYWPGDTQRSLNHPMFGAVVKELFHFVLGIRQEPDTAGWQEILIAPALVKKLPQAKGAIRAPRGEIAVSYHTQETSVSLDIDIPQGAHARLLWQGEYFPLNNGHNTFLFPAEA